MDAETLKFVGAALYACEGTKARRDYRTKHGYIRSVELTNSDPNVIYAFSRFLREIVAADWNRIRGQLFCYPDLDEEALKIFWSNASGIPLNQFQQSIILKAKLGRFKPNPNGTFKVRYSCKNDFMKIEAMIEKMWSEIRQE